MCAVAPRDAVLPNETQERFVDERRRLKGVVRPLASKIAGGAPPQLSINQRQDVVSGAHIAPTPRSQKVADRAGWIHAVRGGGTRACSL
jgi:hypothetical protein